MQWGTQESSPSGIAYVDETIFLAGLTGQRLWAVTFDGEGHPVATDFYAGEYGRIRHVVEGPDGTLWFVTNNTDGRGDGPRAGDDHIYSGPLVPTEAR
jgi:glucose/arabinose dehydrogenase